MIKNEQVEIEALGKMPHAFITRLCAHMQSLLSIYILVQTYLPLSRKMNLLLLIRGLKPKGI